MYKHYVREYRFPPVLPLFLLNFMRKEYLYTGKGIQEQLSNEYIMQYPSLNFQLMKKDPDKKLEFEISGFKCYAEFHHLQHQYEDEDKTIIHIPERNMQLSFQACKNFRDNPEENRMIIGYHSYKSKENPKGINKEVEIIRSPNGQIEIGCVSMSNEEFKKLIILTNHKKNQYVQKQRQRERNSTDE